MDPLAARVARRFLAGKRLANSLPDYIRLVAEDGGKIATFKRAFLGNSLRSIKEAHRSVVVVARRPGEPRWTAGVVKDADSVLKKAEKALQGLNHKFTKEMGYEIAHAYYEEHDHYWDPEMFADGQTKADYGPRPLDPLFDACAAVEQKYMEFWRRFEAKWYLGSMNVTLSSFIPAELREKIKINMTWATEAHDVGLDTAFKNYEMQLKHLAQDIERHPTGGGNAHSLGMGLSALMSEAKDAKDAWTVDFASSLMGKINQRALSGNERATLEQKFKVYDIPPVNYKILW